MENKFTTIKERVLQIIDYHGDIKEDFFKKISMSYGNFKGKAKKTPLNSDAIANILTIYDDISPLWLITGKEPMVKQTESNLISVKSDEELPIEVSIYDAIAYGGSLQNGVAYDEVVTEIGKIKLSAQFKGATGAMFVRDDSMSPLYPHDCCIIYKEIPEIKLIVPGKDYIIETSDYRLVKRLLKTQDKSILLATSINKEIWEQGEYAGTPIYAPFELPIDQILRLSLVLGKL